jgi:hypothetical protein
MKAPIGVTKKWLTRSTLVIVALTWSTISAQASVIPLLTSATIDGESVYSGSPGVPVSFATQNVNGGSATVGGTGDPDPFISFSIAVTDTGAASQFTLSFNIPISPSLVGPQEVRSTLSVTLTDGGTDGITITQGINPIMANLVGTCSAGVDIGTTSSASASFGSNVFSPAPAGIPGVGCDSGMSVIIDFTGSGNGDQYGITGLFEVRNASNVPEPATVGLFAFGLAGLGFSRRKRVI